MRRRRCVGACVGAVGVGASSKCRVRLQYGAVQTRGLPAAAAWTRLFETAWAALGVRGSEGGACGAVVVCVTQRIRRGKQGMREARFMHCAQAHDVVAVGRVLNR